MKNVEIGLLEIWYKVEEVPDLDNITVEIKEFGLKKEVTIKPTRVVTKSINDQGEVYIGYECIVDDSKPITMTGEVLYHPNIKGKLEIGEYSGSKVIESRIEFSINSMTGYILDLEIIDRDSTL